MNDFKSIIYIVKFWSNLLTIILNSKVIAIIKLNDQRKSYDSDQATKHYPNPHIGATIKYELAF